MNVFLIRWQKPILIALSLFLVLTPLFVHAQPGVDSPIVPASCDGINDPGMCGFCDLIDLSQNIINFLVYFAVLVSVLMFVHAGFLLLTGGANEGQRTRAKKIFQVTIFGLVLTLAAWLIVNLIMVTFLNGDIGAFFRGAGWTLPGC